MHAISRRHFMQVAAGTGLGLVLAPGGFAAAVGAPSAEDVAEGLALGHACHAFEHLGSFVAQAEAAAQSGATVIYASGIGGEGYSGLPEATEWAKRLAAAKAYAEKANALGIPVVLGYLCATSIVGLDAFDKQWTPEFRAQFKTPVKEWLQRDAEGNALPSWYEGEYRPGCMNHPDWRAYQRAMVGFQIASGHVGIFFDNPTVHPKGCYCDHCMVEFGKYLDVKISDPVALRALAVSQRDDFRRFRTTIARDFFAEMRRHARTLLPHAVVTANNSTNQPQVLYSQCNLYGYSPYEFSKTEDFVVVEDMGAQPRTDDDGKVYEYGPTYRQLQGLCHGKPLVVCTIAGTDYHTPPNLVRLAMAEAAANQATYLLWATWPEEHRARMVAASRRQVDFLREHAKAYVGTTPRADIALYFPPLGWLKGDRCVASEIAADLARQNLQFRVFATRSGPPLVKATTLLLAENDATLDMARDVVAMDRSAIPLRAATPETLAKALEDPAFRRSLRIAGSERVRGYVHDAEDGAIYIHLLNLDVRKRSSFEDEVFPARDLVVEVVLRGEGGRQAVLFSADDGTTKGEIPAEVVDGVARVRVAVLEVAAILRLSQA